MIGFDEIARHVISPQRLFIAAGTVSRLGSSCYRVIERDAFRVSDAVNGSAHVMCLMSSAMTLYDRDVMSCGIERHCKF